MPLDHVSTLLSSGEFSDCIIECGGTEFKAHKMIICPQSSVLRAGLMGNFEEATNNTFKITTFDIDSVKRMLRFMYAAPDVWPKKSDSLGDEEEEQSDGSNNEGHGAVTEPMDVEAVADVPAPEDEALAAEVAEEDDEEEEGAAEQEEEAEEAEQGNDEAPEDDVDDDAIDANTSAIVDPELETLELHRKSKKRLLVLVRMNCIGDFFQIKPLCEAANAEIQSFFKDEWSPDIFAEAAKIVSSDTGDTNLHQLFAKLAGEHVEDLVCLDTSFDLDLLGLISIDNFTLEFIKNMAARVVDLKVTASSAVKNANADATSAVEQCFIKINETRRCRHCKTDFSCRIEYTPGCLWTYTIRCRGCNTRHPY